MSSSKNVCILYGTTALIFEGALISFEVYVASVIASMFLYKANTSSSGMFPTTKIDSPLTAVV